MTILGRVDLVALALAHEAELARAQGTVTARRIAVALWRQNEAERRRMWFPETRRGGRRAAA